MQLFALSNTQPILASSAKKQADYLCPECQGTVRLRSGPHRQSHFYHPTTNPVCRQSQKSLEHLHSQLKILQLIPDGGGAMERPFPSINRIADCVWETKKIVFEIQCSPIDQEEAKQRCLDYESAGFKVVWVLHEKNFNKKRLSAAEHFLRRRPCYFADISSKGQGMFYDQFEVLLKAKRVFKGPKLPIDFDKPYLFKKEVSSQVLKSRLQPDRLFFQGDLTYRWSKEKDQAQLEKNLLKLENTFLPKKLKIAFPLISKTLRRSYSLLLTHILRKTCS